MRNDLLTYNSMASNHSCMDFRAFEGWLSFEFGLDFAVMNSDPSSFGYSCVDNVNDPKWSSSMLLQNE